MLDPCWISTAAGGKPLLEAAIETFELKASRDVGRVGEPAGRAAADRDRAPAHDRGRQAGAGLPPRPAVGSLFSGIGGLDHGLARAGFDHVFFCESDPWRRTVLAHHWPGVPVHEDVREVGRLQLARDAADAAGEHGSERLDGAGNRVDLLCGGFPCQDLSVAGQRKGLMHAGGRSNLFFEFARIIDAVRPGWVLVENVPGLLSSNGGRDFGTVLGTLADVGYGVAWRVLDSRFFGVPQRRRRVFILAAESVGNPRGAAERAGEVLAVGTRCARHPATSAEAGEDAAVASLSGLGDGGPDDNDGQAGRVIAFNSYGGAGRDTMLGLSEPGISPSSKRKGMQAVANHTGVRRLTPTECERLQNLPDGWTNPDGKAPDSRRYSALGDAVTSSVAEWVGRRIMAAS